MLDLSAVFTKFPLLQTERFILRAVADDDAGDIFRIMSDPRVTHYYGMLPMGDQAQAAEQASAIQAAFREQTGIRWAIASRDNRRFIGSCGYWRLVKEHSRAEIGYSLAPEWWGQGVMPEAIGAVLGFGFTVLGLHSVEAQIHPANFGSRRVLEKLGFEQEGYFRENYYDISAARFTDTAVFSLLKASWASRS